MRLLTCVVGVVAASAVSAQPMRVLEINTAPVQQFNILLATQPSGNATFFTLSDAPHGRELWKTDGTAVGTVRVTDLRVGQLSGVNRMLGALDGGVLLSATEWGPSKLWRSDGTAAGTTLVSELLPGAESVNPNTGVQGANGITYFRGTTVAYGTELWKTDGTAAGTVMLKDLAPGAASGITSVFPITYFAGSIYYHATDGTPGGTGLYRSDGTPGNAVQLSASIVQSFAALGSTLYFIGSSGSSRALFKTDGTLGGTVQVAGLFASASTTPLVSTGTSLFFRADDGMGQRLFKSDGTTAGTVGVFCPGVTIPSNVTPVAFGGDAYIVASTPTEGFELWHTDGTTCVSSGDLEPGVAPTTPRNFTPSPAGLYFTSSVVPLKLYRVDPATKLATAVREAGTPVVIPTSVALVPTHLGIAWLEQPGTDVMVRQAAGLVASTLLTVAAPTSSSPSWITTVGGTTWFAATDGFDNQELWKTDGTAAGTRLVDDLIPGASSFPSYLTDFKGKLLFSAFTPAGYAEAFLKDGPDAGAVQLTSGADVFDQNAIGFVVAGGTAFFADDFTPAMWRTDGTPSGTEKVLASAAMLYRPLGNSAIAVLAVGSADAPGVYRLDAAPATAVKLAASASNTATFLAAAEVNNKLVFNDEDGVNGLEPWVSDGTIAGTKMLLDITPGDAGSRPLSFTAVGGLLYFVAGDPAHGRELWKTDGTAAGTALAIDLVPGPVSSLGSTTSIVQVGGQPLFLGWTAANGNELRFLDGGMLIDMVPGPGSVFLWDWKNAGKLLFFTACTPATGCELWRTDGTSGNTAMVSDLVPGPESSSPSGFTVVGTKLLMNATDALGDAELYSYTWESTPPVVTPNVTGTVSDAGWYNTDVTVDFIVVDPETAAVRTGCDGGTITADTTGITFSCSATSLGGTASASVTVKRDATAPVVTCPADVTVEATNASGALVPFTAPTATDSLDPAPALVVSHAVGAPFPLGKTTVTATATDVAGNVGTCSFDVTVSDSQAPLISCPSDRSVAATGGDGAKVSFVANAQDLLDPNPTLTYSAQPGSQFPIGDTEVTATATDAAGNARSCKFIVTVTPTDPPMKSGCGCGTGAEGAVLLLALAALLRRRRRV